MAFLDVEVNDDFIELVEDEVGMASGGWDCVDPEELCRAVIAVARVRADVAALDSTQ